MRLDEQIAADIEILARIDNDMRKMLGRIADGRDGNPGAQRYDTPRTSGHTSVVDEHNVPMPSVSDPTGELAVRLAANHDRARLDLADVRRAARLLSEARHLLERVHRGWMPRTPNVMEQRSTEAANEQGCRSCDRVGTYSQRTVGDLCDFCRSYQRETSRLPSAELLKAKHAGKGREVQRLIARGA